MKQEVIEGARETGIPVIDRWLKVNSHVIDGARDYNTSDVDIDELVNIAHDLAKGFRRPIPAPRKVMPKFTRMEQAIVYRNGVGPMPKNCKACILYDTCILHTSESGDAEERCRKIWRKL